MIIITAKDNSILEIAENISFLENGYLFSQISNMSYPEDIVIKYEVDSVPEDVTPFNYMFDGENFTKVQVVEEEHLTEELTVEEENLEEEMQV